MSFDLCPYWKKNVGNLGECPISPVDWLCEQRSAENYDDCIYYNLELGGEETIEAINCKAGEEKP